MNLDTRKVIETFGDLRLLGEHRVSFELAASVCISCDDD